MKLKLNRKMDPSYINDACNCGARSFVVILDKTNLCRDSTRTPSNLRHFKIELMPIVRYIFLLLLRNWYKTLASLPIVCEKCGPLMINENISICIVIISGNDSIASLFEFVGNIFFRNFDSAIFTKFIPESKWKEQLCDLSDNKMR